MKKRLFFLFLLFTVLPVDILAGNTITLKVGEETPLYAPDPPYGSEYTEFDHSNWTQTGGVTIYERQSGKYAVIKAERVGTTIVSCDAYYRKYKGDWASRKYSDSWTIICKDGDVPGPDPDPDPTTSNDFYAGQEITRVVDGIPMKFWVETYDNYAAEGYYGPCFVYGKSESEPSVPIETSGHVSIPEIVPNTSGCTITWYYNFQGDYVKSPTLNGLKVTTLYSTAFNGCQHITSIDIPASVNRIYDNAFKGCTSLKTIRMYCATPPETYNTEAQPFPASVYENATLIVPKGAKSAYKNAEKWKKFYNIIEEGENPGDGLKDGDTFTASTEEGVTLIYTVISATNKTCEVTQNSNYDSYNEETKTTTVTIPSKVNGYSVVQIGNFAFDCWSALKTVTIPNSVTSIGGSAFAGCSSLTSITIPSSVTKIDWNPFISCTSLTSIKVNSSNNKYDSRNNCNAIIETSTNTLISGCMNTIIPNNVTSINNRAFTGCTGLASITIPNSVTEIVEYAFSGCSGLTSITIPNSVKLIDNNAFWGCSGLKSIVIGNGIKYIWASAFGDCKELTDFYCYATDVPSTSSYAFKDWLNKSYIENATLHVPASSIEAYKAAEPWKNFKTIEGINEGKKGDVNGDNQVNGTDLVTLTNIILGKIDRTENADVNNDGYINGTDFVALVNIILGRVSAPRQIANMKDYDATSALAINPFTVNTGEPKEVQIELTNPIDEITLVQFDLSLPSGLMLKKNNDGYDIDIAGRNTWHKHQLKANQTEGIIRFLLASTDNAVLNGTSGTIITMGLSANNSFKGGDVVLKDIILVTPEGKEIRQPDYIYHLETNTTAISNIAEVGQDHADVYNLSGQRQSGMKRGINIINGKKIIKK